MIASDIHWLRAVPVFAALVFFSGAAPALSHAQSYPSKTIKLVVPFGPGGPTDVAARVISQVVQSGLGQNVVIDNRPGAEHLVYDGMPRGNRQAKAGTKGALHVSQYLDRNGRI